MKLAEKQGRVLEDALLEQGFEALGSHAGDGWSLDVRQRTDEGLSWVALIHVTAAGQLEVLSEVGYGGKMEPLLARIGLGEWLKTTGRAAQRLLNGDRPPSPLNVLDNSGGFTAETIPGQTLWRAGTVLSRGRRALSPMGTLVGYNNRSFYQSNNDVTRASYKVKGYRYPIIVWFDNKTGLRIA